MARYLITNKCVNVAKRSYPEYQVVFFNPWGFSKTEISDSLRAACHEAFLASGDLEILLDFNNLFFGRRVDFVFSELRGWFPDAKLLWV